jgi:hypothetical protein
MAQLLEQLYFYVAKCLGISALLVADITHTSIRVTLILTLVR